jgi:predicted amidohydrolase
MKVNVAAAQIKPRKGDYPFNLNRIGDLFQQLEEERPETDVLVLPETSLSGYFLEGGVRDVARTKEQLFADLLTLYRSRVARRGAALDVCLGFYELCDGKYYNSAAYLTLSTEGSSITPALLHVHRKFFLPTYGVFDEKRFVSRGRTIAAMDTRFGRAAILICEDAWHSVTATIAALKGAQILYIVSASPGRDFSGKNVGNVEKWNMLLPCIADEHNVWVVYSGLVGFEGGKGFTGSSQIVDPWGNRIVTGDTLSECLVTAALDREDVPAARAVSPLLADLEAALGDVTMELDQIARHPYRSLAAESLIHGEGEAE